MRINGDGDTFTAILMALADVPDWVSSVEVRRLDLDGLYDVVIRHTPGQFANTKFIRPTDGVDEVSRKVASLVARAEEYRRSAIPNGAHGEYGQLRDESPGEDIP